MNLLKIVPALILLSCNSQQNSGTAKQSDIKPEEPLSSEYPKEIDSLDLRKQFDRTKWFLYSYHCDDTLSFIPKTKITDKVTFGQLELRFDTLILNKDTAEIDFLFYYKGQPCDINLVRNGIAWGALYKLGSDSIIYFTSSTNGRYIEISDTNSRERKIKHPDVVKYVNENKNKLDPWFKSEAERRGLLN